MGLLFPHSRKGFILALGLKIEKEKLLEGIGSIKRERAHEERRASQSVKRENKDGKLAYIKEVTLPSEAATSTQGDQNTVPGGADLSEGKDINKVEKCSYCIIESIRNRRRRDIKNLSLSRNQSPGLNDRFKNRRAVGCSGRCHGTDPEYGL